METMRILPMTGFDRRARVGRHFALAFLLISSVYTVELRGHACLVSHFPGACVDAEEEAPIPSCDMVCELAYGNVGSKHDCYKHTSGKMASMGTESCSNPAEHRIWISCNCTSSEPEEEGGN